MTSPMNADYARELRRDSVDMRNLALDRRWTEWAASYSKRIDSLDMIILACNRREGKPAWEK